MVMFRHLFRLSLAGRVVADTEKRKLGMASSRCRAMVDLPDPLGAVSTIAPYLSSICVIQRMSFNVLNLLTNFLQLLFHLNYNMRNTLVICFGSNCIDFAVDLLRDKIQFTTHRVMKIATHPEITADVSAGAHTLLLHQVDQPSKCNFKFNAIPVDTIIFKYFTEAVHQL